MAKEIASEKTINVKLPHREFLLDIKNRKYQCDELVGRAENLKKDLEAEYAKSSLTIRPKAEIINDLLFFVRKKFYLENLEAKKIMHICTANEKH